MLPFTQDYLSYLLSDPDNSVTGEHQLANGTSIQLIGVGALQVIPKQAATPNKAIILSAGIHGNETAPIEWLNGLLDDLLALRQETIHPLLILFGHPHAMRVEQREIEYNLNRLFAGAHRNHSVYEAQRASQLETWVSDFFHAYPAERFHYDLHTAIRGSKHEKFAVAPYIPSCPFTIEPFTFLQNCDVYSVLFSHQATTTFSYYSAKEHDAQAFTVELGKVHPFGKNDLNKLRKLDLTIRQLLSEPLIHLAKLNVDQCHWFDVRREVIRQFEDFRFCFPNDLPNFTQFKQGEVIGYQGEHPIMVDESSLAVVFPNPRVELDQRAALLVRELSRDECHQRAQS